MLGSCDTDAVLFGGIIKGPSIIHRHNILATNHCLFPRIQDDVKCRSPNGGMKTASC